MVFGVDSLQRILSFESIFGSFGCHSHRTLVEVHPLGSAFCCGRKSVMSFDAVLLRSVAGIVEVWSNLAMDKVLCEGLVAHLDNVPVIPTPVSLLKLELLG